jgi:hypothetical protein
VLPAEAHSVQQRHVHLDGPRLVRNVVEVTFASGVTRGRKTECPAPRLVVERRTSFTRVSRTGSARSGEVADVATTTASGATMPVPLIPREGLSLNTARSRSVAASESKGLSLKTAGAESRLRVFRTMLRREMGCGSRRLRAR